MKEWTRKLNLLHYVGSSPALGAYDGFKGDHGVAFKHPMGGWLSKHLLNLNPKKAYGNHKSIGFCIMIAHSWCAPGIGDHGRSKAFQGVGSDIMGWLHSF